MGTYLNMSNSLAQTSGGQADENFARESMQLFSIGTVALNQDGSAKLDSNGNTIPTYTPAIVQAFAKAYTGYTFANADCSGPVCSAVLLLAAAAGPGLRHGAAPRLP